MRRIDNRDKLVIAAEHKNREQQYWLQKLAGVLKVSRFPYRYQKETAGTPGEVSPADREMQQLTTKLSGEVSAKLKTLSNNSHARLFMILTAALDVLLYKYTGNSDIIIGTAIDKQETKEEYLNTVLPLRNRLDGGMTFKEHLLAVRNTIKEAYEHRNYPVSLLVEQLHTVDNAGFYSLLEVVVLLENIHDKSYIQDIHPHVIFSFKQTETGFNATLDYNAVRYEKEDMERIAGHLIRTLEMVLEEVDRKIAEIDILRDRERKRLLEDFNRTDTDYPGDRTVHRLFEDQVERTPDNIALVAARSGNWKGREEPLTYRELNEKANRTAHWLREEKGVTPGSIVGIMMPHCQEMIVGLLGILKAGGAYLPIGLEMPANRIYAMIEDTGISILLTCSRTPHLSGGKNRLPRVINLETVDMSTGNTGNPRHVNRPRDQAYVLYTSGSTGTPKGVSVEHRSVVNVVTWYGREYRLESNVHVILLSDYTFDASVNQIFGTLLRGATLYVVNRALIGEPEKLREYLEQNRVNVINFVPVILGEILGYREKIPGLRTVISGADRLDEAIKNKLLEKGYQLYNQYGPTETTIDAMACRCMKDEPVTLGTPVANMACYVLDRDENPVPPGVAGELYAGGAGVARGYINNPELTRERFLRISTINDRRVYRTGDLTRWGPEGKMEFLGRIDHQVKVRGYRIEPGEIENQLIKCPGINANVVVVRDGVLCCYYTAAKKLETSDIRDYLTRQLPHYMIPTYFVRLERLPLTGSGKLDRNALPDPKKMIGLEHNYKAPETSTQREVVRIWAEVLGIEEKKIGIHDDFFELGGNSVNTLKIVFRVGEAFQLDISVAEFFVKPTVEGLAESIDRKAMFQHLECVVKLNAGSSDRNLFLLHPGSGDIQTYVRLARALGKKYNVYGIQPKGLMRQSRLPRNPTQLLSDYLREIKKIQTHGPYLIGGHCVGSRLAYDLVGILEDRGEPVEKLIIIDAMPFLGAFKARYIRWKRYLPGKRKRQLKKFDKALNSEPDQDKDIKPVPEEDLKKRKQEILDNMTKVRKWMNPGKIVRTPTLIIKAQQNRSPRFKLKYWQKLIDGDIKFVEIPGDHDSIFITPYVNRMARVLKRKL